jgi:hypothetical protein
MAYGTELHWNLMGIFLNYKSVRWGKKMAVLLQMFVFDEEPL